MFQCKNGKFIDMFSLCDSVNNCGDYSDELSTESALCGKFDSFYCRNAFFAELQSRTRGFTGENHRFLLCTKN